jgi:hypothetical protein
MYDYLKIWIEDSDQIERILNNKKINFRSEIYEETAQVIKRLADYKNWKLQTLSPRRLEITGSIHKYWNNGTNENDLNFCDSIIAINSFCDDLVLNPGLALIKNLEFGLNLNPTYDASELIDQIICFQNKLPLSPYDNYPNSYFIEFALADYYLKIYDKGKQYKSKNIPNTLRIEVKAMNNDYLQFAKIKTLEDLMQIETMQELGKKIAKVFKGLVLDDDSIVTEELPKKEKQLYKRLGNPRAWKRFKGNSNSTIRDHRKKFKKIIELHGERKIYTYLDQLIEAKCLQLTKQENLADFLSNTYIKKTRGNNLKNGTTEKTTRFNSL